MALSIHLNKKYPELIDDEKSTHLFTSTIKKDQIEIDINKILFIKADGNYVDIFLEDGVKKTVRNNLHLVSSELSNYTNIYQSHRSYLINLEKIKSIRGNALGYMLTFSNNEEVPVSRNKLVEFRELIEIFNRNASKDQ